MNIRLHTFKPKSIRILLCIVAYLPMMFGGAGAFVLCFGDGGHLAIEFAHEGGHDHTRSHMEGSGKEHHGSISHDDCNSCFDIPLTVDNADPHTVKEDDTLTASLILYESLQTASVMVDWTDDVLVILYSQPPPLRHFLEALSTTVLRT